MATVVIGARAADTEARGRYLGALAERQAASNILSPSEVGGEYSAGRLLQTTLGGQVRSITQDDLRTFRQNVKLLGGKFKGGITARNVIDLSRKEDRDRAGEQIRTAIPLQTFAGRIHFVTNSGPDSRVSRHHVHIELLNYSAAISSPGKVADMVKALTTGPLKFDCDCEHHRYTFRYIATVGKYNAGVQETGFPKLKNPHLVGVACKHVLRVMQQLTAPLLKPKIEKMIEDGRNSVEGKKRILSKKEAQAIADEQAKRRDWKRNRVESTGERRLRLAQTRAIQAVVARSASPLSGMAARKVETTKKQFETNARKLMAMGVLTQKQLQTMLGKL